MQVEIDTYRSEYASQFGALNRVWLQRYNLMEPIDEAQLADPKRYFLDCGGQIFVALHNGQVIGTCAVLPSGVDELELAKLTVAFEFQGQGIARRLVERCIAYAREKSVPRVILVSNSQLQAALRLYESLGFEYQPVPEGSKYAVADTCMVLDLRPIAPVD